ncbi:phosphatase PAP2 family protein [Sphingomonas sp. ST-64]|uniref:Phosphatase PAP2 family protein n=1 Tax=Sphingomonas plantiphila TaxID=3163295 RepID=A0ABW8YKY6_9SPHN
MTRHDPILQAVADTPVTPDQSARDPAHPPFILIAIAALATAVGVIALLGRTIAGGARFAFDTNLMLAMREGRNPAIPDGPVWFKQAMVDITALGGGTVLTLAVVLTVGLLVASRHLLTAALVVAGTITGSVAVGLAKLVVGRERPALVDHLVEVGSASFPSGHAANSAIVYLTIALLGIQVMARRSARMFLIGVTLALVAAIGVSRIYLGVHWPSDVLAGWSFGALWALAWWAGAGWLRLHLADRATRAPTAR